MCVLNPRFEGLTIILLTREVALYRCAKGQGPSRESNEINEMSWLYWCLKEEEPMLSFSWMCEKMEELLSRWSATRRILPFFLDDLEAATYSGVSGLSGGWYTSPSATHNTINLMAGISLWGRSIKYRRHCLLLDDIRSELEARER